MSAVTLTTLRTLTRERADMVGSSFVADSATGLDAWINEGISILHEKLVAAYGDEYAETTVTGNIAALTVTNGALQYTLPADFLKLYEVDLSDGSNTRTLQRYNRAERNTYKNSGGADILPRYKLSGGVLRFLPSTATGTYYVRYAPAASTLVNGADTITFPSKWERYVVVYAAIQALAKEESSVGILLKQLEKWDRELEELAMQRDLTGPVQSVDLDEVNAELA